MRQECKIKIWRANLRSRTVSEIQYLKSEEIDPRIEAIQLDLKKMIADFSDKPDVLESLVEAYIHTMNVTPLCVMVALNSKTRQWDVFDGVVNLRTKVFTVGTHIQSFPVNRTEPRRPPTQAMNLASNAALAAGLSLFIP